MLLPNVHENLLQNEKSKSAAVVRGNYQYYHYCCDGVDDRGWGCGYRTLQTVCSWIQHQISGRDVPKLREIQQALVAMGDKPDSFVGSKQWIGSLEVAMCLDYFYDVPGKILHISNGAAIGEYLEKLEEHFHTNSSPIMMGGDDDNSSKGILGVNRSSMSLLVLDPHYSGKSNQVNQLLKEGWVQWKPLTSFHGKSFYNLCLPQLQAKNKSQKSDITS